MRDGDGDGELTQSKSIHVGQGPRQIVPDMELRHEHGSPPARHATSKRTPKEDPEDQQASSIGAAQNSPHDELSMLEADEGNKGLAHTREEDGTREGPGHGAGKCEMVVGGGDALNSVGAAPTEQGEAIDEDIVGGLEVEGLLYLCVGCEEEVDEGGDEEERGEGVICFAISCWPLT